jgi:hypothetical protein
MRIFKVGLLVILALLFLSLGSIRSVASQFTDATAFINYLPLTYYVAYYFTITLIVIFAFRDQDKKPINYLYGLSLLLLFALLIDFPRYLFTNPFQREVYHQAQIFHIISYGNLSGIPEPAINVLNPVFWSTFIEVSSLEPLSTILYFAPTFLVLISVLSLFLVLKRVSSQRWAFVGTFFMISFLFEAPFANRYTFVEPLFILFIGWFIIYLNQQRKPIAILLFLLTSAICIAHVGAASLILIFVFAVSSTLVIWHWLQKNKANEQIYAHAGHIALFSLGVYGLWYFIDSMRNYGIKFWIGGFISILQNGFSEIRLSATDLPLKPFYELTFNIRLSMVALMIVISVGLAAFYIIRNLHHKNDTKEIIGIGLSISYLLFLIPLTVGAIEGMGALRFLQYSLVFSSFLIVLLLPKRLLKLILLLSAIFSISIVFVLWVPNLGYIQVSDRKIQSLKFASQYIPQNQVISGVGVGWIEQTLLTTIFSERTDLRVHQIYDPISYQYINSTSIPFGYSYIMIDSSVEKYESKYVINPGIHQRIIMAQDTLVENSSFNLIYDSGYSYSLLYKP